MHPLNRHGWRLPGSLGLFAAVLLFASATAPLVARASSNLRPIRAAQAISQTFGQVPHRTAAAKSIAAAGSRQSAGRSDGQFPTGARRQAAAHQSSDRTAVSQRAAHRRSGRIGSNPRGQRRT